MRRALIVLCLALAIPMQARVRVPSPTPSPTVVVDSERIRLLQEVEDLRLRLHEEGRLQAERARPDWWDLPSRRRQTDRLRRLRFLERELEQRLQALEALKNGK